MIKTSASITVQYDNPFAPFAGTDWKNAADWVKNSGFDAAELIISDPNLLDAEEIGRYIDEKKLCISTISTGQCAGLEGLSMTSPSQYIRELTFKRICDDIDFSARLNKPNVTIGLIRGKGGALPYDSEYNMLKIELSRACDYAAKKGVILNFEPINMFETKLVNSTLEGVKLLNDIGNPECCGLLYDTFHSNIEDHDILGVLEECFDKISHIHYSDSNRRLPGEGNYDYASLAKLLKRRGYDSYVSLEVFNKPSAQHIIDFAAKRLADALK